MANIEKIQYHYHPQVDVLVQAFDDAVAGNSEIPEFAMNMEGMSGKTYRRFINNYMRLLDDPSYLEVGTWKGSTLCSAIGSVPGARAVAVDNFSYGGATLEEVLQNVNGSKAEDANITVLDQYFEDFDFTKYGKFNVYMYDGAHDEESQCWGIIKAKPALNDVALIIVDDWNKGSGGNNDVQDGTVRGLAGANLEVLYKIDIDTGITSGAGGGGSSEFHCGYGLFLVRHK